MAMNGTPEDFPRYAHAAPFAVAAGLPHPHGGLIALNLAAGITFYLLGAWPVVGFMGLDVVLVWWAFRLNYADAGATSASRSPT